MSAGSPHGALRSAALSAATLAWLLLATALAAQEAGLGEGLGESLVGRWVINEELSQNTDDRVEAAIKAAGGRVSRGFFNRREDYYRGGPPEHELYDRISYDDVLVIEWQAPEFRFSYEDDYRRVFHTDGRRRRSTAADFYDGGGRDWSFGYFEGDALIVEGQPRDGGFSIETYSLESGGERLRVEMIIQPASFAEPIELTRVYDRVGPA